MHPSKHLSECVEMIELILFGAAGVVGGISVAVFTVTMAEGTKLNAAQTAGLAVVMYSICLAGVVWWATAS